jgi:hypothetical protein
VPEHGFLPDIIPPDMRAALQEFDRRADEIARALAADVERQAPPETIYHTNAAGLAGILDTAAIHASRPEPTVQSARHRSAASA